MTRAISMAKYSSEHSPAILARWRRASTTRLSTSLLFLFAAAERDDGVDVRVRSRDDVRGHDFANTRGGRLARIASCLHSSDIAVNDGRHVTAAGLFIR